MQSVMNVYCVLLMGNCVCLSGVKTPDILRERLRKAVKKQDMSDLEKAVRECEAASLPELGYALREAREAIKSLGGSPTG